MFSDCYDECSKAIRKIVMLDDYCIYGERENDIGMTNYNRIQQMSIDEMAEWLSDIFDCDNCTEHERLSDNLLLKDEQCDQKCVEHCKEWLMSEVKRK